MAKKDDDFRIEHDTMGDVRVPKDAKWGASAQRAVDNFPISGLRIDRGLIAALAQIKGAAAVANARLKLVDKRVADAILASAEEVAAGTWDDQFPVDVYQTGSGTSSNTNMNEVLANLASERLGDKVHPNDHVNASQSSNDVFPSAIHVAATVSITNDLVPALAHLASGQPSGLEHELDVFGSRQQRHQAVALQDESAAMPQPAGPRADDGVLPDDAAGRDRFQCGQRGDEGGLARPRNPRDGGDLAGGCSDRDVVEHLPTGAHDTHGPGRDEAGHDTISPSRRANVRSTCEAMCSSCVTTTIVVPPAAAVTSISTTCARLTASS